jgi:hypothetical protein
MRAVLTPLFGEVPCGAENLSVVGTFIRRFEEHTSVTLWPQSGVLQYDNGSIETETIWVEEHLKQCGDFESFWSRFPAWHRGRYFNLSLFWWSNYYHWFNDVLPRLYGVVERLAPDVQVILPRGLTALQRQTLELIGLPVSRCVTYSGRRPWKVARLLYVSPVAMTGDHEPESLSWMRDKIRRGVLAHSDDWPGWRRLYVTRRRAACRRIVNETELQPILDAHRFETVECESLSFREQVRLFSEASIVVGPHGGALTNILWCGHGISVFEIQQPHAVRRCYWSLARALGHNHFCGIGDAPKLPRGEPDITVDIGEFREALTTVIKETQPEGDPTVGRA